MNYQPVSLIDGSGEVEEARRLQQRQTINAASVQLGAAVKAASALARWANQGSVAYAIDQAIEGIQSEIDNGIRYYSDNNPEGQCYPPETCGALIHAILSVPANWPDPRPLSFVTLFVAANGREPGETAVRYLREPSLIQGVPEGTDPVWRFIWATLE